MSNIRAVFERGLFALLSAFRTRPGEIPPSVAVHPPEMITDQSCLCGLLYGRGKAEKTACGAAAVYNLLRSTGKQADLQTVMDALSRRRCLMLQGRMGTNPYRMRSALRDLGIDAEPIGSKAEFLQRMQPGDKAVISIWNNRRSPFAGMHLFYAEKTPQGEWLCWNRSYAQTPLLFHGFDDVLGGGRFCLAWRVKNG